MNCYRYLASPKQSVSTVAVVTDLRSLVCKVGAVRCAVTVVPSRLADVDTMPWMNTSIFLLVY